MLSYLLEKPQRDALAVNTVEKETVASRASRFHWPDILKEILSKGNLSQNISKLFASTLIHIACRNDDFEMMKCLVNCGQPYDLSQDINLLDCVDELTPLQFICKKNDQCCAATLFQLPQPSQTVRDALADLNNHNPSCLRNTVCCHQSLLPYYLQFSDVILY